MNKRNREIKENIQNRAIDDIHSICKSLNCSQSVIQSCVYVYITYVSTEDKQVISDLCEEYVDQQDFSGKRPKKATNNYIVVSSILLGCKLADFILKFDKLITVSKKYYKSEIPDTEQITNLEIEMCKALDFNFEVPDRYKILKELCTRNEIDKEVVKCAWILLNDTLYLPFEDLKSLVLNCIYLANIIIHDKENREIIKDMKVDEDICMEILSLYK